MTDPNTSAWEAQRAAMGAFIRSRRELANMSLREFSRATRVSNAYLSQIERGKNDPTVRVLVQIGDALQLTVEELLEKGTGHAPTDGETPDRTPGGGVNAAIRDDPVLTTAEKEALIAVYRSYMRAHEDTAASKAASNLDSA